MPLSGQTPLPHQVFTPASPPLEKHNIYVNREVAESDLRRYVQRHQVPVVWGEYGVGKTTLVKHFFKDIEKDGRLVYIASVAGTSLPDIFRTILEYLEYSVEVESTVSDTAGAEGGFDFQVIKASAKGEATDTWKRQMVVTSPTDNAMNSIVRDSRLTEAYS